ncbi:SWIM zinc finger family protein [Corynebacterium hindlerae]|uniref:SWIM zinc finger family protein n=1 Tax=Corynebacterium hindlerae TaxID=699041 RepID=UPI003AAAE501
MTTTLLDVLTEESIQDAAGSGAFGRGKKISRSDIRLLHATESEVTAEVQGTWPYRTTLTLQGNRVATTCSCPVGTQWCKHAVALALSLLAPKEVSFDDDISEADPVDILLESANPDELRQLLNQLRGIPEVQEFLELTALKNSGDDKQVRDHVKSVITTASRKGSGTWDYRKTMDLAMHWSEALDVVEAYLDEHRGVAVRPQIERAIKRLNTILQQSDDSSGMLGDQLRRSYDMHVRACADGVDKPQKLADWLAKETLEAPFFGPTLRDYAGLLDAAAIDSLEAAIEANPPAYLVEAIKLDIAFLRGDDAHIESLLKKGRSVKDLIEFYESRGRKDEVKALLMEWDRSLLWNEEDFFENRIREYLGDRALLDYRIAKFQKSPSTKTFDRVIHGPGATKDLIALIPEGVRGSDAMKLQAALRFDDPELGLSVVDSDEVSTHGVFDFARSVLVDRDPERALELMLREPERLAVQTGDSAYKQVAASAMEIISCFSGDLAARATVLRKMEELAIKYKNRPKMLKIWRSYGLIG